MFLPSWCCDEIAEQESISVPDMVIIRNKKNRRNIFFISDSIYEIDILQIEEVVMV